MILVIFLKKVVLLHSYIPKHIPKSDIAITSPSQIKNKIAIMRRIMNHTTLVIVAALAATSLIIGTTGILQPAAATNKHTHVKLNIHTVTQNITNRQEIQQGFSTCNNSNNATCANNVLQASNSISFANGQ